MIRTGKQHTVCLGVVPGTLICFGSNVEGQLGFEDERNFPIPTELRLDAEIVFIACGSHFTACVDTQGRVWTFGLNDRGHLGMNDSEKRIGPQNVKGIPPVLSLACGGSHTLCIDERNNVWGFGSNRAGQLGFQREDIIYAPKQLLLHTPVTAVACGGIFSLLLTDEGMVWGCGSNYYGQLGLGNHIQKSYDKLVQVQLDAKINFIGCGYEFSFFGDEDGNFYACGMNASGQLGIGKFWGGPPAPVLQGKHKVLSCGYGHCLCIDENNELHSFGKNYSSELGVVYCQNRSTPTSTELNNVFLISQGPLSEFSIIKNDEGVWVFGANSHGQLGIEDKKQIHKPTLLPNRVSELIANPTHPPKSARK